MKIFLQKVSPFLSLALWLAAQGLYVQVHCTQLGAQLRFKILVIWLNTWTPTPWKLNMVSQHDVLFFERYIYIYTYIYIYIQSNMAKLRIHVKFHECNTKNEYPRWENPFEPPSFLWKAPGGRLCHGRGMVAARQFPYLRVERAGYRFSKSTKSSDFQTPQMSFFKAKKATKKPGDIWRM